MQSAKNLPKWALEDYKGDEQDFTEWLEENLKQILFGTKLESLKNDTDAMARIDAQVKHTVMERTKSIKSKADRAFIFQAYEANRTGWFRYLDAEMDTVEELLASLADGAEERTSEAYDLSFLSQTAIPLLKAQGVAPEDVWGLPFMTSKARAIVPALRDILKCPTCGMRSYNGTECVNGHPIAVTKEQVDSAVELTKMVADETISARDIRDKVAEFRGKATNTIEPIQKGEIYMLPGGKEMVVIKSPSKEHTRAIEMALGKIVANGLNYSDIKVLANELSQIFTGVPIGIREEEKDEMPW